MVFLSEVPSISRCSIHLVWLIKPNIVPCITAKANFQFFFECPDVEQFRTTVFLKKAVGCKNRTHDLSWSTNAPFMRLFFNLWSDPELELVAHSMKCFRLSPDLQRDQDYPGHRHQVSEVTSWGWKGGASFRTSFVEIDERSSLGSMTFWLLLFHHPSKESGIKSSERSL